jgi:lipoprotein signal peptidase
MFYVIATFVGLGLITWFFLTTSPKHTVPLLGLGLLAGGAIGNLFDRLTFTGLTRRIGRLLT